MTSLPALNPPSEFVFTGNLSVNWVKWKLRFDLYTTAVGIDGPRMQSGKTTLANILSDSTENIGTEYRPTQGVRIIEFETQFVNNKKGLKAEIELWDCSGDLKFEPHWPAMYRDAHGIIFVYDPNNLDSSSKLDYYFESFVNQNNIGVFNEKTCLVIKHGKSNDGQRPATSLSNNFSKIFRITVDRDESNEKLLSEFRKYISGLLSGVRDRNEQEELNILTVA